MKMKKSIMLCSFIVITLLSVSAILFINSTLYRVSRIENEWQINLPNHMKLEYESSEVHIDGSINYYVFTSDDRPSEDPFSMNEVYDNNQFETLFINALDELNVPHEFNPNLDEDYKYMLLSGTKGIRATYLYLIFSEDSNKYFICYQVSQYKLF